MFTTPFRSLHKSMILDYWLYSLTNIVLTMAIKPETNVLLSSDNKLVQFIYSMSVLGIFMNLAIVLLLM